MKILTVLCFAIGTIGLSSCSTPNQPVPQVVGSIIDCTVSSLEKDAGSIGPAVSLILEGSDWAKVEPALLALAVKAGEAAVTCSVVALTQKTNSSASVDPLFKVRKNNGDIWLRRYKVKNVEIKS